MEARSDNPYQSPVPVEDNQRLQFDREQRRALRVGEAIVYWERLRLVYNGILLVESLLVLLITHGLGTANNWFELLIAAFLANLCFSAGPIVSAYMAWFDVRSKALDMLLFTAGTIISVVWAYMTVRF